jgi:hypothetical protein
MLLLFQLQYSVFSILEIRFFDINRMIIAAKIGINVSFHCKLREVTAMLAEQNGRIPAASGR